MRMRLLNNDEYGFGGEKVDTPIHLAMECTAPLQTKERNVLVERPIELKSR